MAYVSTRTLMRRACQAGTVIPAFNIPYLPMVEPVVKALRDCNSVGMIVVARLEWKKFESRSLEAVRDEYEKFKLPAHTRLHLDHVPVIDEDGVRVDYLEILTRAVKAGYESIMVDASRLSLEENMACTRAGVEMAHAANVPVEAELGAVMLFLLLFTLSASAAERPLVFVFTGESNSGGIGRNAEATPAELAARPSVQIMNLTNGLFTFESLLLGKKQPARSCRTRKLLCRLPWTGTRPGQCRGSWLVRRSQAGIPGQNRPGWIQD